MIQPGLSVWSPSIPEPSRPCELLSSHRSPQGIDHVLDRNEADARQVATRASAMRNGIDRREETCNRLARDRAIRRRFRSACSLSLPDREIHRCPSSPVVRAALPATGDLRKPDRSGHWTSASARRLVFGPETRGRCVRPLPGITRGIGVEVVADDRRSDLAAVAPEPQVPELVPGRA